MMNHRTLLKPTLALISAWLLLAVGCGGESVIRPDASSAAKEPVLLRMRYTIQVGAFSNIDNAVRLTESLERQDLDAYHFLHSSGLYKVRFENFRTKQAARSRAVDLQRRGIIDGFYIVEPKAYAAAADPAMEMSASGKKLSEPPGGMSACRIVGAANPPGPGLIAAD